MKIRSDLKRTLSAATPPHTNEGRKKKKKKKKKEQTEEERNEMRYDKQDIENEPKF